MDPIPLRVTYSRPTGLPVPSRGVKPRLTVRPRRLRNPSELEPGDHVYMSSALGRMVLVREDREGHAVLRCWKFFLDGKIPRGRGIGTRLHRAVEDRVRDMDLLFCTADDGTVDGNAVTSAMRARLLELYPKHVQIGDAYVLLGDRT